MPNSLSSLWPRNLPVAVGSGHKPPHQLRDVFPDVNYPVDLHLYSDCFRSVKIIVGVVRQLGEHPQPGRRVQRQQLPERFDQRH